MVQFDHAEIARPSSSRLAAFDDSASVIRLTAICAPTVKRRAPEVKPTGRAAPNLPVASLWSTSHLSAETQVEGRPARPKGRIHVHATVQGLAASHHLI